MCVPPSFGLGRVRMLWRSAPLFFALLIAVTSMFWPLIAYAGTITVDGTTCTLPDAIAAANTDLTVGSCTISGSPGSDTLLLTAPTYSLPYVMSYSADGSNANPSITSAIVISSALASGSTVQRTGATSARLFHVAAAGDLTLLGVTVRDGNSSNGGGIYNRGRVTLNHSNLIANSTTGNGGGFYNQTGATVAFSNTQILSNTASTSGGGLYNNTSNTTKATLFNTQVISNSALTNGGGIYNHNNGSIVTLTASDVISNSAAVGGGIYNNNNGSRLALNNVEIRLNRATTNGGGLYNNIGSTLSITNTQIISNSTSGSGGGIYNNTTSSRLTLNNVEIRLNRATTNGGGLFSNTNSIITITNTQILSNSASGGGGGFYNSGTATITNTLFLSNTSIGRGGGLYNNNTATLTGVEIGANTAISNGGGLLNLNTAILSDTQIISNTSLHSGGGLYNGNGGTSTLLSSDVIANAAELDGGGLYNASNSTINLSNSDILSNTSSVNGGGFYNNFTATLNHVSLLYNQSTGRGGGIYNGNRISLANVEIGANLAMTNGGGIYNNNTATFTNTQIISNTTFGEGGGLYNNNTATFTNTQILSNTASGRGGGLYNTGNSVSTLTNTDVKANRAGSEGGGLYNVSNSKTILLNADVLTNTATGRGGGIYNSSTITLTAVEIGANTSMTNGGGIYNNNTAIVTNTQIVSNTSGGDGGGLYNINTAILTDTAILSNTSSLRGGGIYNSIASTINLTNADVSANRAGGEGGGFYNSNGTLLLTVADIVGNHTDLAGGAFYQSNGQTTIVQARILANEAGTTGGALLFASGAGTINESCIVSNSDLAVNYLDSGTIDALNNWWGAPDGPSGAALGAGDSITNSVLFSPFESSALLDCTARSADVAVSKQVTPFANLLPGQPLTFTVIITNNDTLPAHNLRFEDSLPAVFQLSEVISSGSAISQEVSGFRLPSLASGDSASFTLRGTISSTLNADQFITNTATVSNSLTGLLTATASANVKVPVLRWSQTSYSTAEDSGLFTATVVLSPTNPYAAVTAQATIPATTNLTFTAGVGSQPVAVPIVDDAIILSRTIPLTLLSALGAALDDEGDLSTILLVEDDAAPALAVEKHANTTHAYVGETITYTYRITNTGNVSLTIGGATDDKLGALAGLLGYLDLLATRTVTLTHLVQAGDLPGPLVNTVAVTATDFLADVITPTTSASITLLDPTPALVVEKRANLAQAFVGETITYSYRLTNTGNITLSVVSATDDKLGALAGLLGQLGLAESRSVTLTHLVQASDLPGPLVNTVTVSGTDRFGNGATDDASVSVTLADRSVLFSKRASSSGDLLPGQPLTYTLTITNTDAATLNNLVVSDLLPAAFQLDAVETSGPSIALVGDNYVIAELLGLQVATIDFVGTVDPTPTSDFVLTNTATLSNSLIGTLTAAASNNVVVPLVSWSDDEYMVDETNGIFTATLLLSPANPYGSVSVQVIVTEGSPSALQTFEVLTITFPPNSTSQPVVVSFVEDGVVVPRTFSLQLQSLSGGVVGGGVGGGLANLEIIEADADPAIAVAASVNTAQASVGQTISYTYRITNTGNVTFATISGVKDGVETVDGLAGALAPNQSRTVIFPYVVQESDLPGPLVSTLVVTATDVFDTVVSGNASTSVNVNAPTALPDIEQPQQPRIQLYLPSLQGD